MLKHETRDVELAFHVDEFIGTGTVPDLKWIQKEVATPFEPITATVIGSDEGQSLNGRFLNREISWRHTGICYQADIKHAKRVLKEMGMTECTSVLTPGVKNHDHDSELIDEKMAKRLRRVGAILSSLAQDRPVISYAVKEVPREEARPTVECDKKGQNNLLLSAGAPPMCVDARVAGQAEPH